MDSARGEITTSEADAENDRVEVGHYGMEGWTATRAPDFKMTEETAVTIANEVFLQLKGKDFLTKTIAGIGERDNRTCYSICRYKEPVVPGGDLSVTIRKSDGKIMRIVAGE